MRSLFSPDGTVALRGAVQRAALLVFDFDGTLAPIVDDPVDAVTPPETVAAMVQLQTRFKVAVISGRARHDLVPRLGFTPDHLVGNHGAEADGVAPPVAHAEAAWIAGRISENLSALTRAGVHVEDKGLSWTFHYRRAPDRAEAVEAIGALLVSMPPGLQAFDGKCCVNVVLRAAPTKGSAVERLVGQTGAKCVFFIGDDVTDETVYRVSRPGWVTVHVGRTTLATDADFYVDTQREVLAVLRLLHGLAISMPR